MSNDKQATGLRRRGRGQTQQLRELLPEINAMRSRGMTAPQIADWLRTNREIAIGPDQLRGRLAQFRRQAGKSAVASRKRRAAPITVRCPRSKSKVSIVRALLPEIQARRQARQSRRAIVHWLAAVHGIFLTPDHLSCMCVPRSPARQGPPSSNDLDPGHP